MNPKDYEVHDRRFRTLIQPNAFLEKLDGGSMWAEGPVYFPAGDFLVWSDIPRSRMMRWTPGLGVSVFRANSNFSNGNTRDRQGRMVKKIVGFSPAIQRELDDAIERAMQLQ